MRYILSTNYQPNIHHQPVIIVIVSTLLKNMKVSWDDDIPNKRQTKSHIPNHQPVIIVINIHDHGHKKSDPWRYMNHHSPTFYLMVDHMIRCDNSGDINLIKWDKWDKSG